MPQATKGAHRGAQQLQGTAVTYDNRGCPTHFSSRTSRARGRTRSVQRAESHQFKVGPLSRFRPSITRTRRTNPRPAGDNSVRFPFRSHPAAMDHFDERICFSASGRPSLSILKRSVEIETPEPRIALQVLEHGVEYVLRRLGVEILPRSGVPDNDREPSRLTTAYSNQRRAH